MPTKTDATKKASIQHSELENDFKTFFNDCSGSKLNKFQLLQVLLPLKIRIWKEWAIKYGVILFLTIIFILLAFNLEFLTWNLAALGRLSLIRLRPIWNWEEWNKARCFIGKSTIKNEGSANVETKKFLEYKDCFVCENIETIPRVSNISYQQLHDKFLLRGAPIIITDSNELWPRHENVASYLLTLPDLIHSKPCELQTNLAFYNTFDLKPLLHIAEENIDTGNDEWFLHFRNCEFEAVKSSRAFIPKPYYYSPHLEPPYTSWILLSQNYYSKEYKKLSLLNLVIVQQLSGTLDLILEAKDACVEVCGSHYIQIVEGEALILMSKLWNLKYLPSAKDLTVTVLTETYFL